jgi:perosamine synthetase
MSDPVIRWWRTDLGDDEIASVATAIRGRRINQGPECRDFEAALARYLGLPYVVATTSGSVALLLALKACGVGPGDEVIVPALTFIAPAHAALWLGATVRLVDVLPHRPVMNPLEVRRSVSERTKAVICVHLNGRAVDVTAIRADLPPHRVAVIEDCAQALGSRTNSRCLGTLADVAAFSLSISKLITTGEGGFVATADAGLHLQLAKLRNHGVLGLAKNVFPEIGFNFRLTDLQAAVGLAQLRTIDARIAAVRRIYRRYQEMLRDLRFIQLLEVNVEAGELPLWVEAVCAERATVVRELAQRGIEAKPFHPCLSESPHLQASGDFPNARRFAAEGLILPCGPNQSDADVDRVGTALRDIAAQIIGTPTNRDQPTLRC